MHENDAATSTVSKRFSVAIIGGGISGLGAAHTLSPDYDVTIFEARKRFGGHARTLIAGRNRNINVDTGFMVFNDTNYPHLNALFSDLDIPSKPSDMSFAVSLDDGKFEFGVTDLHRVFADKRNIFNLRFWRLLLDILKFNRKAKHYLDKRDMTLAQMLTEIGVSKDFALKYLCPLAGAIWSSSMEEILDFPAHTLIRFFENHGLLSVKDGPQWYTVDGGSALYVERLTRKLAASGCELRADTPVLSVSRIDGRSRVESAAYGIEDFDHVIMACHSDQALEILADPSAREETILKAIRYRANTVVLHDDVTQMPSRKAAWASWVYKGYTGQNSGASFTYWMNFLQSIPMDEPLFVTLNPDVPIDPKHIYDVTTLWHPQFDKEAIAAQNDLTHIQGHKNTWFCGAYTRYGFHEDGLSSGIDVAQKIQALTYSLW